jgi:hypothetical protein
MRSYMKVFISRDELGNPNGVFENHLDGTEGPFSLQRFDKSTAIGNLVGFLQPGVAGIKQWRLYADQGSGFIDTGTIVPPEVFAFVFAYSLNIYPSHPEN